MYAISLKFMADMYDARGVQELSAQPDDGGGGVGSNGLTLFCHVYSRQRFCSSEMILLLPFHSIAGKMPFLLLIVSISAQLSLPRAPLLALPQKERGRAQS